MVKATCDNVIKGHRWVPNFRGLEGVVGGEVDGKEEHTPLIGAV